MTRNMIIYWAYLECRCAMENLLIVHHKEDRLKLYYLEAAQVELNNCQLLISQSIKETVSTNE